MTPMLLALLTALLAACTPGVEAPDETAAPLITATDAAPSAEPVQTPEEVTPLCTGLEVNQALSFGMDDGGNLYPMDTFVAGKTTAVIARFDSAVASADDYSLDVIFGDTAQSLNGKALPNDAGVVFTVSAQMLEAPGEYAFMLTGSDTTAYASASFVETRPLRLLLVPIRGYFGTSSGVRALAESPTVNVLFIDGVLYRGENGEGDAFECTAIEKGRAHIDEVDIDLPAGSCAFIIENGATVVRSALYFEPQFYSTGEPPVQLDRIAVSLCIRLPEDGVKLRFYHSVSNAQSEEGWMEFGGWEAAIPE